jgi:hypothetical protein
VDAASCEVLRRQPKFDVEACAKDLRALRQKRETR